MNAMRRKQIKTIKERIEALMFDAAEIADEVEAIRDDEQEYRNNLPQAMADGEKGEKSDVALEALQGVLDDLESLIEDPFTEPLTTAAA